MAVLKIQGQDSHALLGKMGKALEYIQEWCSNDFQGDDFGAGFGGCSHVPQLSHKSRTASPDVGILGGIGCCGIFGNRHPTSEVS